MNQTERTAEAIEFRAWVLEDARKANAEFVSEENIARGYTPSRPVKTRYPGGRVWVSRPRTD